MADTDDLETTRKRLKKAVIVAEKLKNDAVMEHEVNVELAKRNDALRHELACLEERLHAAKLALWSVDISLKNMGEGTCGFFHSIGLHVCLLH